MLHDRKELVEYELAKAQKEAANMYLSIAIGGAASPNDDVEYAKQRDKISDLKFDLDLINSLIAQGHE